MPYVPPTREEILARQDAAKIRGPLTPCAGSGTEDFELRTYPEMFFTWACCAHCGRILKPTGTGRLRRHQPRNRHTASLDRTRDILWDYTARQQEAREAAGTAGVGR